MTNTRLYCTVLSVWMSKWWDEKRNDNLSTDFKEQLYSDEGQQLAE